MRYEIAYNPDAQTHRWPVRVYDRWGNHVCGMAIDAMSEGEARTWCDEHFGWLDAEPYPLTAVQTYRRLAERRRAMKRQAG